MIIFNIIKDHWSKHIYQNFTAIDLSMIAGTKGLEKCMHILKNSNVAGLKNELIEDMLVTANQEQISESWWCVTKHYSQTDDYT